jgi:hypothetical protein
MIEPNSDFDANLPTERNTYYNVSIRPDRRGSTGPRSGRAIVFRDSYFEYMKPLLMDHFEAMMDVGGRTFDEALIEQEKPDLVMTEIVERFVNRLQ